MLLFETPPNIGVDFTFTLTSVGSKISTPPNIALAFIVASFSTFALLKSKTTLPKTASRFAPLKLSLSLIAFCSAKVAVIFSRPFFFPSFTFSETLLFIVSLNIIESPIAINITGTANFPIIEKLIIPLTARSSDTPNYKSYKISRFSFILFIK